MVHHTVLRSSRSTKTENCRCGTEVTMMKRTRYWSNLSSHCNIVKTSNPLNMLRSLLIRFGDQRKVLTYSKLHLHQLTMKCSFSPVNLTPTLNIREEDKRGFIFNEWVIKILYSIKGFLFFSSVAISLNWQQSKPTLSCC